MTEPNVEAGVERLPLEGPILEIYQAKCVDWLAKKFRALIQAPAGSGKTVIAAAALHQVVTAKPRTRRVRLGWIANTIEQCDQARKALSMFPVFASSLEVLIACPAGVPAGFECDVLVVDEGHHSTAPTWEAIIDAHQGALWIFTATPFGEDDERNERLRKMIRGNVYVIPRSDVKDRVVHGQVYLLTDTDEDMRPAIDAVIEEKLSAMAQKVVGFKFIEYWTSIYLDFCEAKSIEPNGGTPLELWNAIKKDEDRSLLPKAKAAILSACKKDLWPRVAYAVCLDMGIAKNERRNQAIIRLCEKHRNDSVLVLINAVAHGEALAERLGRGVVCHSKMGVKRRRNSMRDARDGSLKMMFATSLADEGLNLPIMNVLILAGGGRSAAKVEQRTGRVLRTHGDKTHGIIYDFKDPQHPLLSKQALRRQRVYAELGYGISNYGELETGSLPGIPV